MKCAHEDCGCFVTDGEFCSSTCRTMATEQATAVPVSDATSIPLADCGCGHPDCIATQTPAEDA